LKLNIFWLRYIELVGAFVAFGWLVAKPSWEPLTVFIAAVGALFYSERKFLAVCSENERPQPIKGQQKEDRNLYDRLIQLLPSNGIIDFINKHDMAGDFDLKRLDPLSDFIQGWGNPLHEFLDVDLENAKSELHLRCKDYSSLIGTLTFPNDNRKQSVPPEWETDRFNCAVKKLHDKAREVVNSHERLVRKARRKLNL